jgi:hypothetical protein
VRLKIIDAHWETLEQLLSMDMSGQLGAYEVALAMLTDDKFAASGFKMQHGIKNNLKNIKIKKSP